MISALLAIVVGIALLVWSADRFVIGAAATAKDLGMSTMMIGLTIVSIGTSAPEIFVSATAAFAGTSELALGNAIGSNIANVGLVLGVTAIIAAIPVRAKIIRVELPILAVVTLMTGALLWDQRFSQIDGLILAAGLLVTLSLFYLFRHQIGGEEGGDIPELPLGKALFWLFLGMLLLILSARILVWGATEIALDLGVSELIIGLTLVALGTSLPELAASVASALKGHHDLAIGNVIGSNIFNLLAVLAVAGIIHPTDIDAQVINRDYIVMALLTGLLILWIFIKRRGGKLGQLSGLLFLSIYIGYMYQLYSDSTLKPEPVEQTTGL